MPPGRNHTVCGCSVCRIGGAGLSPALTKSPSSESGKAELTAAQSGCAGSVHAARWRRRADSTNTAEPCSTSDGDRAAVDAANVLHDFRCVTTALAEHSCTTPAFSGAPAHGLPHGRAEHHSRGRKTPSTTRPSTNGFLPFWQCLAEWPRSKQLKQ